MAEELRAEVTRCGFNLSLSSCPSTGRPRPENVRQIQLIRMVQNSSNLLLSLFSFPVRIQRSLLLTAHTTSNGLIAANAKHVSSLRLYNHLPKLYRTPV